MEKEDDNKERYKNNNSMRTDKAQEPRQEGRMTNQTKKDDKQRPTCNLKIMSTTKS